MASTLMKENQEELVKDPVCGMEKPISEMKVKTRYEGKVYYFCTEGDKKMFEAYPKHWIPKGNEDGGEGE